MDNVIRYVSQEKEIQIDELKKLADFRREFIANISHELKTPIFSAQGFVHTLLDGAIKDKNVRLKFLRKAAKALDALDLLVQDLLTLSQIEIGDIKMHFEYFDIIKLTREIIDQLEERAEKKEVRISIESTQKKILVYADYQRIHQVLNNLLINAIKYNKEGGAVKVSFEQSEDFVLIKVADTGEGIAEEHRNRIFERFYRVEKSRSRRGGGTGLGLAIVKHILEGHNTSVDVSSKVGHGTIFSFKLARGEQELVENSGNVKI
jgi:two-component system phosphate regulon sensor histidine kinase PhoR